MTLPVGLRERMRGEIRTPKTCVLSAVCMPFHHTHVQNMGLEPIRGVASGGSEPPASSISPILRTRYEIRTRKTSILNAVCIPIPSNRA